MAWATPQHSRKKVDAAGEYLARAPIPGYHPDADEAKWNEAFEVVVNWRASHTWPLLSIRTTLSTRANTIVKEATVTQRLKRLVTIVNKLIRHERMKLTQMQDLGGCRAIMPTVTQTEKLAAIYRRTERRRQSAPHRKHEPECIETYDYIKHPKTDGYRGVHFVYKYHSRALAYAKHDSLRIEIQIRSHLQHVWATALEAIDLFTMQALKSNLGTPEWHRFFLLTSGIMARRERRPLPPGIPADKGELLAETRKLFDELKVTTVLRAGTKVVERFVGEGKRAGVFLLSLNTKSNEVEIRHYEQDDEKKANAAYEEIEKQIMTSGDKDRQVVLVSTRSLIGLRTGYSSFFLDTAAFMDFLREALNLQGELSLAAGADASPSSSPEVPPSGPKPDVA